MLIILDYDNDAIRLMRNDKDNEPISFRKIYGLKLWESILKEIFNMLFDGKLNINVILQKQDEGQITTIEEY